MEEADVVCPYPEAPLVAADEVGVVLADPQVIHRHRFASIIHLLDDYRLTIMPQQQVTRL